MSVPQIVFTKRLLPQQFSVSVGAPPQSGQLFQVSWTYGLQQPQDFSVLIVNQWTPEPPPPPPSVFTQDCPENPT